MWQRCCCSTAPTSRREPSECFTRAAAAEAADGGSLWLCSCVTRPRRHGFKALHMAAGKDHVEVAELLLQAGADVNAKTE